MLIPGTFTICPRAVALYAHRIARGYASAATPYRLAFSWGMKEATDFAMGVRDIAIADAEAPAEVRTARDELLFWQCQSTYTDAVRENIARASEAVFRAELRASVEAFDLAA